MREREECDFGLQWFALNMAGTLLQSSPRGGNHGHRLAIERREGEDCWTIECAGYCYHSSERIRSPRRITRTSQDERSEEHTSELQSPCNLVCRLLLEKKKNKI